MPARKGSDIQGRQCRPEKSVPVRERAVPARNRVVPSSEGSANHTVAVPAKKKAVPASKGSVTLGS